MEFFGSLLAMKITDSVVYDYQETERAWEDAGMDPSFFPAPTLPKDAQTRAARVLSGREYVDDQGRPVRTFVRKAHDERFIVAESQTQRGLEFGVIGVCSGGAVVPHSTADNAGHREMLLAQADMTEAYNVAMASVSAAGIRRALKKQLTVARCVPVSRSVWFGDDATAGKVRAFLQASGAFAATVPMVRVGDSEQLVAKAAEDDHRTRMDALNAELAELLTQDKVQERTVRRLHQDFQAQRDKHAEYEALLRTRIAESADVVDTIKKALTVLTERLAGE